MASLLLRLAGPMQAWGVGSRFVRRTSEAAPTKSGVIGLLAAARGSYRTDPITDLVGLSFAVRIDQPGQLIRDFQTTRSLDGRHAFPLSYRYYLSDAVFVATVEGDDQLIDGLREAILRPHFPLYLGRRSCPPGAPLVIGVHEGTAVAALTSLPWQASAWHRRRQPHDVRIEMIRDAGVHDTITETVRDEPITFDPARREHGWRLVVRDYLVVPNPDARPTRNGAIPDHEPMAVVGG